MILLETPQELAECIVDMCGIYGIGPEVGNHDDTCRCRTCVIISLTERIRQSVMNEQIEQGVIKLQM